MIIRLWLGLGCIASILFLSIESVMYAMSVGKDHVNIVLFLAGMSSCGILVFSILGLYWKNVKLKKGVEEAVMEYEELQKKYTQQLRNARISMREMPGE